ncbi:MAG: hypothetical protein ABIR14_00090 [Candidatus Paceibacterota bacterium]
MGQNFFGIEEAIGHFGVNPSERQVSSLATVPWSEETLYACRGSHVLVAVFRMSIFDIRCLHRNLFRNQEWFPDVKFTTDKGEVGWWLVCKTPRRLRREVEEIPKAQVMAYTMIGNFLVTGERLFEGNFIRCSDSSEDDNVVIGFFPELIVDLCDPKTDKAKYGISAALKR